MTESGYWLGLMLGFLAGCAAMAFIAGLAG